VTLIGVISWHIMKTSDRKLALLMGRLTAEDAVKAIETTRCNPELVSVQVSL